MLFTCTYTVVRNYICKYVPVPQYVQNKASKWEALMKNLISSRVAGPLNPFCLIKNKSMIGSFHELHLCTINIGTEFIRILNIDNILKCFGERVL